MEGEISYGLVAVIAGLLVLWKVLPRKSYKYPPGPKGRPVVGSLFDISTTHAHFNYTELCKQHGDVMAINMMGRKVVILSSSQAIREAFVNEDTRDAFAGRPWNFFVKYCDKGPSTAYMMNNDLWKSQRQFLAKTLKIFDGTKHTIENTIREQLEATVEMIKETKGKPFEIKSFVVPTLANIIAILIVGKRFEFDDPALKAVMEYEKANCMLISGPIILTLTIFPFLRHLPGRFGRLYRDYQRTFARYLHFFYELPKKTFDPNAEPRGYIDSLFKFQLENPWYKDDNIKGIIRETVAAGMATTRGAMMSFFLIILHKPEVMRRIQQEIAACTGGKRLPDLTDKSRMAYTEATTMEILRYLTVAPLGLPHSTSSDVAFRDYFLPKGTLVFANQWAVHHDEEVWGDPWVFRPERFLGKDGNLLPVESKERKNWLAFGVGRRACLGETFARTRMFLFITTLLQRFDFRPCTDEPLPPCDPRGFEVGITMQDPRFRMCAFERDSCE